MIKYEGTENIYLFDKEILKNIIRMIDPEQYYKGNGYGYTKENVWILINEINSFIDSITPVEKKVMLERKETEEEAREYFGADFVKNFDRLLTILDKQQTTVALHGTDINNCPLICENGLKYKDSSLFGTTVRPSMAYGKCDMHYDNYAGLLNWKHGNVKGIVILAIPYECYYKEGLWNHYKDTNTDSMSEQDYKIDPDFVVGYLDIDNKRFIVNPKYSRQHNYDGYVKDTDIFIEGKDMNNTSYAEFAFNQEKKVKEQEETISVSDDNEKVLRTASPTEIEFLIEDMRATFNTVIGGSLDGMNEEAYGTFLGELVSNFKIVKEILPLLKTNEQVRLEREEEEKMWSQVSQNSDSTIDDPAWDMWDKINSENASIEESSKIL